MTLDPLTLARERAALERSWSQKPGLWGWLTSVDHKSVAKRYIVKAVRHSYPLGAGHGPVSPLWRISTDPV